jgi:phenylacetate-coenzyme A ligase PaaK-like adenylate-forming protein
VNEDLVLLEALDGEGRPARPGEPCARLLVTDLFKRSCPIIRYELNDIVTMSPEPCPCGSSFRVIESIRGRADDMFWFPSADGSGSLPFLPDFVARAVVACLPEAREWCAVQESPALVRIRVEPEGAAVSEAHATALRERLGGAIAAAGCVPPRIELGLGPTGAGDFDRKYRRVRRNFALPNR